jgi:hypothetical protein
MRFQTSYGLGVWILLMFVTVVLLMHDFDRYAFFSVAGPGREKHLPFTSW